MVFGWLVPRGEQGNFYLREMTSLYRRGSYKLQLLYPCYTFTANCGTNSGRQYSRFPYSWNDRRFYSETNIQRGSGLSHSPKSIHFVFILKTDFTKFYFYFAWLLKKTFYHNEFRVPHLYVKSKCLELDIALIQLDHPLVSVWISSTFAIVVDLFVLYIVHLASCILQIANRDKICIWWL